MKTRYHCYFPTLYNKLWNKYYKWRESKLTQEQKDKRDELTLQFVEKFLEEQKKEGKK